MVILYADTLTDSMKRAMDETARRRRIQEDFNRRHNIVPTTIQKPIASAFDDLFHPSADDNADRVAEKTITYVPLEELDSVMEQLEKEMQEAARALEFEKAAKLRDEMRTLRKQIIFEA